MTNNWASNYGAHLETQYQLFERDSDLLGKSTDTLKSKKKKKKKKRKQNGNSGRNRSSIAIPVLLVAMDESSVVG